MKKFLVVFLLSIATICSSQVSLEVNQDGKYRVKQGAKQFEKWENTDITPDKESLDYIDFFAEAIANPDQPVLVSVYSRPIEFKGFTEREETICRQIVYNKLENRISLISYGGQREFRSYLILFSIASLVLMVVSNILSASDHDVFAVLAMLAVLALVFIVFYNALPVVGVAGSALTALIAAFLAGIEQDYREHGWPLVIYYILIIINIILLI